MKDFQNGKTRSAYAKVATDLVTFSLLIITGGIKEFETAFTPEMKAAGQRLLETLRSISQAEQDVALQAFLFSLYTQKRCGDASKYTLLAYTFLVLYSFSKDGTLQKCNSFSQHFSKVVFSARATIFNHISAEAVRETDGFFE